MTAADASVESVPPLAIGGLCGPIQAAPWAAGANAARTAMVDTMLQNAVLRIRTSGPGIQGAQRRNGPELVVSLHTRCTEIWHFARLLDVRPRDGVRMDNDRLTAVLDGIPEGRWASYADVALPAGRGNDPPGSPHRTRGRAPPPDT